MILICMVAELQSTDHNLYKLARCGGIDLLKDGMSEKEQGQSS